MKKRIMLLVISLYAIAGFGFPKGCDPLPGIENTLDFKAKGQVLFYVHNKGALPIYLSFINKTGTAHAGWTTKLDPDRWSALTINDRTLSFHCIEEKPGSEQRVRCYEAVEACTVQGTGFDKGNSGSYWVSDNADINTIIEKVRARNIKLKED